MSRSLRVLYKGACYHVMSRGVAKGNIFLNDEHREIFLQLLNKIYDKYEVEILSYCLMDNHFHLLIKTNLANLDKAVGYLLSNYVRKFNQNVGRDGPLFRGRYKSILVEEGRYLLNLTRYIHKNPSTAGIIKDDKLYQWSSYQYFLNQKAKPKFLSSKNILSHFNNQINQYVRFVEKGSDDMTKAFFSEKIVKPIFGSKGFMKKISEEFFPNNEPDEEFSKRNQIRLVKHPFMWEVVNFICIKFNLDRSEMLQNFKRNKSIHRNIAIYLTSLNPVFSSVKKAEVFGISASGYNKSCKRFSEKMVKDQKLNDLVLLLKRELYEEF